MRLAESGMSQNAIARLHHIPKRSISDVLSIAKERGLSFGDVASLTDEEAYRQFYPDRHVYETVYRQPDYTHVHEELKRVEVSLSSFCGRSIRLHAALPAACLRLYEVLHGL